MGNKNASCACCQNAGSQNNSEDYELKKTETSDKYPKVQYSLKPPSNESAEKSYIYAPDELSSIDFVSYSEDSSGKDFRTSKEVRKPGLNATSLHTIEEISNSEVQDFFPSELLDTQELIRGNVSTGENISRVLELKLSDSFSFEELEFDDKLRKI